MYTVISRVFELYTLKWCGMMLYLKAVTDFRIQITIFRDSIRDLIEILTHLRYISMVGV